MGIFLLMEICLKIFYCGDIVARPGREAVNRNLPIIKETLKPDAIILNVDNAAHGFGATPAICRDFIAAGANAIVTGDHVWNQKDIVPFLNECKQIARPINYHDASPGRGFAEVTLPNGQKILVIEAVGRVFMEPVDCPVQKIEQLLKAYNLGKNIDAIFIDFHAEATAEKMAFAHYFDGRVSAVIGSHTHVQTNDARILCNGTAYMTDAGMCGDESGVIGFDKNEPVARIAKKYTGGHLIPGKGNGILCGVSITTDDKTGLATDIKIIRM